MTGALAGLVGCAITLVIGVPLDLLTTNPRESAEMLRQLPVGIDPDVIRQVTDLMENQTVLFMLLGWLVQSVIMMGFATLGGVIGVGLFEKRKGQTAPPSQSAPPPGGFTAPPADEPSPPPPAEQPPPP